VQGPAEWKLKAACRGEPTEFFFEDRYLELAKTFCARCEVQRRCWLAGYKRDEYGVWGGVMRNPDEAS